MLPIGFVIACTAVASSAEGIGTDDPAAVYVHRFLDETVRESRFTTSHHIEYHVDVDFPEYKPSAYAICGRYAHWVSPPVYRFEADIGPFEPSKQEAIKTVMVWNGESHVLLRHSPNGEQSSAIVERSEEPRKSARSNKLWEELGIPSSRWELDEASHKSYWLRNAVRVTNGYVVSADTEFVSGTECAVIQKGTEDRLWFSINAPIRLLRRDCWRNFGSPARQLIELTDYREDGLPARVVHTHYIAVNRVGDPSQIRGVETLHLDLVEFGEVPADKLVLNVGDKVAVFDVDSLTAFQTEKPGTPPFDKLLSNVAPPPESRGIGLVEIHLLILGIIASIWGYRRFKTSQ